MAGIIAAMPRSRSVDRDAARFGRIINAMRVERGWTLKRFASFAEMNATYLGLLERGYNIPSLNTILHLAEVFGVDVGDLMREVAAGRKRRAITPTVPSLPTD